MSFWFVKKIDVDPETQSKPVTQALGRVDH
jgi:hypothetical protein